MTQPIVTERLTLVPATVELIALELSSAVDLAAALKAELPRDWPPEFHTDQVLRFTESALGEDGAAGWWLHYFLARDAGAPRLIGTGGFKGPPSEDGVTEIGYSVVCSAQRRGYATEAAAAMVDTAFARGARLVRAETLPHLSGSIAVMERTGLAPTSSPREGVIAFEIAAS